MTPTCYQVHDPVNAAPFGDFPTPHYGSGSVVMFQGLELVQQVFGFSCTMLQVYQHPIEARKAYNFPSCNNGTAL